MVDDDDTRSDDERPRIDFSTLILSLGTSALVQMGEVANPETGQPGKPDALLARQTIDTLDLLREKTKGNLEPDEEKLFDSLLYELHMKFVELTKAS